MLFASEVSVDLTVENIYSVCLSYYTRNMFECILKVLSITKVIPKMVTQMQKAP